MYHDAKFYNEEGFDWINRNDKWGDSKSFQAFCAPLPCSLSGFMPTAYVSGQ